MKDKYLLFISIFIGIILWMYVFTSENNETVVSVPITLYEVIPGTIASVYPEEVSIKLAGPQAFISKAKNTQVLVNVSEKPLGQSIIELSNSNIKTTGLEIVDITPDTVQIKVARTIKKNIRVEPKIVDEMPKGFKLAKYSVYPTRVEVEGAYSDLNIMESISTAAISLSEIRENTNINADLETKGRIKNISPDKVKVSVEVIEDIGYESYFTQLKCAPGTGTTSAKLPIVSILCQGRADLLENLESDNLADIDCRQIGKRREINIIKRPPSDDRVKIISITPETIRINK